jgi:hypothetical protein
MPAVEVGPGGPCQCISILYLMMLELNRASSKYGTNRMSRLSAGVVCPLVKTSLSVSIETD